MNKIEGDLNAAGKSFAIVAARFNELFSERLITGAVDAITRHGGSEADITLLRVPGSFEIPCAVKQLALLRKFDGIIA